MAVTFEDEIQRAQKLAKKYKAALGDALPDTAGMSHLKDVEAMCRPLRELDDSPAYKFARLAAKAQEEAQALESAVERAKGLMHPVEGGIFSRHLDAAHLGAFSHRDHDKLGRFGSALQPLDKGYLFPSTLGPGASFHPAMGNSAFSSAEVGSALRSADQLSFAQQQILGATQSRAFGEAVRMAQWVGTLTSGFPTVGVRAFDEGLHAAVGSMRDFLIGQTMGLDLGRFGTLGTALGRTTEFESNLAVTQLRMAALAGVDDVFGSSSQMHLAAYQTLFGHWHTRPDLPPDFWIDRRAREEMYREADVDAGLIEAEPSTALEVMVESGLVRGFRGETGIVALITIGDTTISIMAGDTATSAFNVLRTFELQLRSFIEKKLRPHFDGENWFKRAASNLVGQAKDARRKALARGEQGQSLIHYTDLGDLANIIQNDINWRLTFNDVFENKAAFQLDMGRIVGLRHAVAHMREIDPALLTEMACVIHRLNRQMSDDGAWKIAADSDI